ncbi:MAG: TRAP transporter substrate-binding protein DctP, partial [Alphaproteobacteria bacterium]|nr:TRAP transporter substrate-binding protein DctP [Alphaproteobacteria bacterium]
DDLQGMTIRVADRTNIPFIEALGASPVSMSVSEVNQALANGVVDGVMIDPAGIRSFRLNEVGNYVTLDVPGGAAAFAVAMASSVYNGLGEAERAAVDATAGSDLSAQAGETYERLSEAGLALAEESGLEIISFSEDEVARMQAVVDGVMPDVLAQDAGDMTVGEVVTLMTGQ